MIYKKYLKDPDSETFFIFDFASLRNGRGYKDYLDYGEVIISASAFSSGTGLVVGNIDFINDDTALRIWLTGGVLNTTYTLTSRILTSMSRKEDSSISIFIDNL